MTTHVEIYWSTLVAQLRWVVANAFIRIGNKITRQLTVPQGAHESPSLAAALVIVYVAVKIERLLLLGGETIMPSLTPAEWRTANIYLRVARLLMNCVAEYVDDVGVLIPVLQSVPQTLLDAALAISEIHDNAPILSRQPTFPDPLVLKREIAGP